MREIKFRAWNEKTKTMFPNLIDISFWLWRKHPIMQYTGLEDSKGKGIYEQDIVSYIDEAGKKREGKVLWLEDSCRFYAICLNGDWEGNMDIELHKDSKFEVIGNIYENPEFIKEVY